MRATLALFLIISLLFPVAAFGEILTIKHTVRQALGNDQSPDDAWIYAIAKAKREALEKAGTTIASLPVVQNIKVEKDDILALTAGFLKAEVFSQENYHTKDAFGIEVIVEVVMNTSVLEERVKKLLQDKTHLSQLKDTQKREKELLQRIAQLEEENRKLSANKQSTQELKKEFQQASQGLMAMGWFYKAGALWDGGKYTDPKKAIEYLDNALKLQLDFAESYCSRGIAYDHLGHLQRAIEDYNEALRLKPNEAEAYYRRGNAYRKLGQHQRAIEDFNEAIRLKPVLATAYYNRGKAYASLGQKQRAIEDFNEAIRLQPALATAYFNRGKAYGNLGQKKRAIEDFNEVIRLKPDDAAAYYNRGIAYDNLGQLQRAIEDFNVTIRLKPDDADAYTNRGGAYFMQGNKTLFCRDVEKACALGDCKLLEMAKGKRYCR